MKTALGEVAANLDIHFETQPEAMLEHSWLDGEDVSDRLRFEETGDFGFQNCCYTRLSGQH